MRTNVDWDIITLTESWLPCTQYIPYLSGYSHFKTDNNLTQNEGVVVYVNENLEVSVEELQLVEANCLQVRIDHSTILLAIYRPPGYRDVNNFINSLDAALNKIDKYTNIIITGDLNINIHDQCHDPAKDSYLNLLALHGLLPAHVLPTRQSACLDHLILKTSLPAFTLVAHSSLTDHDTVLFFLAKKPPKQVTTKSIVRINHDQLDADLRQLDFEAVYASTDPHVAAEIMITLITQLLETNSKTVKVPNRKRIVKPWVSAGLLRCIRHKDNLHKKLKTDPDNHILKTSFTRYRNYCDKLLKKAKTEYEKKEIKDASNNTKQLWTAINKISNRTKNNDTPRELLYISTTPKQSVNDVNSFFANIGRNLAEKTGNRPMLPINDDPGSGSQSMVLMLTDEAEVTQLILSLRDDCAMGWDRISSTFLKRHLASLVPPITYLCNLAISTGKFPKVFKKSIIHPIFKGGDRNRVNNYRPIAVLPAISKILERILNKRLVDYLEKYNLLSPSQYGFRAGKSTSDAVHDLTNHIVTNLDGGKKVLGIFLDLAKAFDTVSVPILIRKMERLGIRGTQLGLFEDYLSERTQSVKVGGSVSDECQVNYGVPQGSVLGPTLFLIYINELGVLTLPKGKVITFADDTALLFTADTWSEVFMCAQSGFNIVTNWLRDNVLTLNAEKTKYVTFSLKRQTPPPTMAPNTILAHTCPFPHSTTCTCVQISRADCIKYLGVIVDSTLRFQEHIHTLKNRLRKLIYVFKTLRNVTDDKIKKMVYYALAQSLITYCITSWGGAPKSTLLELERAQRAILKVSLFLPYRFPTVLLYQKAKVLTVRQLFIQQIILKQHRLLAYNPSLPRARRRFDPVVNNHTVPSTSFSKRFFFHLGRYLYNKVNRIIPIYELNKIKCKMKLYSWLQELNYEDTENLLTVLT